MAIEANCLQQLGTHDYHVHGRERIFVFGRAHGLQKGTGSLTPFELDIWYFPFHFL